MRFTCANCAKTLQMADAHAGKRIRCPSCQAIVQAPAAPTAVVEAKLVKAQPVVAKAAAAPAAVRAAPVQPAAVALPPTNNPLDGIDLGQIPMVAQGYSPGPQAWHPPRAARKKSSKSLAVPILLAAVGGLGVSALGIVLVGIGWLNQFHEALPVAGASAADSALNNSQPLAAVTASSLPIFPDLGRAQSLGGVNLYTIDLGTMNVAKQPGAGTKLRVYLPLAATDPKSIACVLVAPAGTNLLHGNDIDSGNYHDETLPYARAGMAVVNYSLDGPLADMESFTSERQMLDAMSVAYQKFSAAEAGVTNGRIAVEFVLAKLPQVDPARIYCAGHSSAATVALELAAKEPRIAKVVAFAPITNLSTRLAELRGEPALKPVFPNLDKFLANNSPMEHVHELNCPVFLFHARDDSNEPWSSSDAYARLLKSRRKNCTFESVDRGEHYESMINAGIPKAIEWLKH